MTSRKILTLDLGQHTGWAVRGDNGEIVSGCENFVRSRLQTTSMIWLRFSQWIDEIIHYSDCELIAYEDVKAHSGTTAAHWYGGFQAHLLAAAERNDIPCIGVGVKSIKLAACGIGTASKLDVLRAMRAKGHDPKNDNEADALAILYYVTSGEYQDTADRKAGHASGKKGDRPVIMDGAGDERTKG